MIHPRRAGRPRAAPSGRPATRPGRRHRRSAVRRSGAPRARTEERRGGRQPAADGAATGCDEDREGCGHRAEPGQGITPFEPGCQFGGCGTANTRRRIGRRVDGRARPAPSPLCRSAECEYASASTVSATRHERPPHRRARSRVATTPRGRETAVDQRRARAMSATAGESADCVSSASRMARILRMRRTRARGGCMSHVAPTCPGPSTSKSARARVVDRRNERESSLIDRLVGQCFEKHPAEFAHRASLTDPGWHPTHRPCRPARRDLLPLSNSGRLGLRRRSMTGACRFIKVIAMSEFTPRIRRRRCRGHRLHGRDRGSVRSARDPTPEAFT